MSRREAVPSRLPSPARPRRLAQWIEQRFSLRKRRFNGLVDRILAAKTSTQDVLSTVPEAAESAPTRPLGGVITRRRTRVQSAIRGVRYRREASRRPSESRQPTHDPAASTPLRASLHG